MNFPVYHFNFLKYQELHNKFSCVGEALNVLQVQKYDPLFFLSRYRDYRNTWYCII